MTYTSATTPLATSRLLGLVGVAGGVVLLAAFLIEIPAEYNDARLVIFNLGSIAIVIAVSRIQAPVAPKLVLPTAAAAVIANAWYLAMVVLAAGRPEPFAGDFGMILAYASGAMWLTDSTFGFVALRLGVVGRWGALALAIGSALAITGIDRLGLTSGANPTLFGPLALAGVALNGIGWILLGLHVVARGSGVRQER